MHNKQVLFIRKTESRKTVCEYKYNNVSELDKNSSETKHQLTAANRRNNKARNNFGL